MPNVRNWGVSRPERLRCCADAKLLIFASRMAGFGIGGGASNDRKWARQDKPLL
jgi:hypothetical protein